MKKRYFYILIFFLIILPFHPVTAQDSPKPIRQWASFATGTTQYSDPSWSFMQATGSPDTEVCGDIPKAWASTEALGVDTLELTYDVPVIPTQVNVYQTYNPGSIVRIELTNSETGAVIPIPDSADPPGNTKCPGVFTLDISDVDAPVDGVFVYLDQTIGGDWNEIDAVELVGFRATPLDAGPDETPLPQDSIELTQTFTDSTGQFSINFPDGWAVTESNGSVDVSSAPDQIDSMRSDVLSQDGVIFVSIQPAYTLSEIDLPPNAEPQTVMNTLSQMVGATIDAENYPVGEDGLQAIFPADAFSTAVDPRIVAFSDGSNTTAVIIIGDYEALGRTVEAMLATARYADGGTSEAGDGDNMRLADTLAAGTTSELTRVFIDSEGQFGFVYPDTWGTDMLGEGIALSTDPDDIASPDSEMLTEAGALLLMIQPAYTLTDLGLSPNAEPVAVFERLSEVADVESSSPADYVLSDVTGQIVTYPAGAFDFVTESQMIAFTRDNQTTFVAILGDYAAHEATVNAILDSIRYDTGSAGIAECPTLENPPINRVFDLDTPISFASGISYMYPFAWEHTVVSDGFHEMRVPVAPAVVIKIYDLAGLEETEIGDIVSGSGSSIATESTLNAYQDAYYPESRQTAFSGGTILDREVASATFRTQCGGEAEVNMVRYSNGAVVLVDMFNAAGDLPNAIRDVVNAIQFELE